MHMHMNTKRIMQSIHFYIHTYIHTYTESTAQLSALTTQHQGLASISSRLTNMKQNEDELEQTLFDGYSTLSGKLEEQDATLADQSLKLEQQKKLIGEALERQKECQKELVKAVMGGLEDILTKQVFIYVCLYVYVYIYILLVWRVVSVYYEALERQEELVKAVMGGLEDILTKQVFMYLCVCVCVCVYIYIYIYIYQGSGGRRFEICSNQTLSVPIYIQTYTCTYMQIAELWRHSERRFEYVQIKHCQPVCASVHTCIHTYIQTDCQAVRSHSERRFQYGRNE
jgi:hypothetical protein